MSGIKRNFVIKMRIVGNNGLSQIHRIRLSHLQEEDGSISYRNLADAAIQLRHPNTLLTSEECDVTFTYYDTDNDSITISSTIELFDAIEQFEISKNILRVTANVTGEINNDTKTPKKKIPAMVESGKSSSKIETSRIYSIKGPKFFVENNQQIFLNVKQDGTRKSFFKAVASLFLNDELGSNTTGKPQNRPFLHCRHTCDICECTPIIGHRYHIDPDIDLCTNCYNTYDGKRFDFVPEELECDRPFQDLWHDKLREANSYSQSRMNFWWNQGSTDRRISEREILRQNLNKAITQNENDWNDSNNYNSYSSLPRERKLVTVT